VSVEPGADEELPQPRRHRDLPRTQRLRLDLGIGALLLGAVAVGATAISHHDSAGKHGVPGPSSAHRTTALPGLHVATDFVTLSRGPDGGWLPRPATRPQPCPSGAQCITTTWVPGPAREALQDAFPGATITAQRMARLYVKNYGDALTALNLEATQGDKRITLALHGAPPTDASSDVGNRTGTVLFGGHRIVSYETALAQYDVLVQVVAPAGDRVSIAALAQLASDGRLLDRN
jgi:hypothetical protein